MALKEDLIQEFSKIEMTWEDFNRLSIYITSNYGIKLPEVKKVMLQSRLQKRLRTLGMQSFKEYCDFVFTKGNEHEIINMIDLVSTNKTDFYREPEHYNILNELVLPNIVFDRNPRIIKIWSAGCSSGEEPYSLAITTNEFLKKYPNTDFSITASDISIQILSKAIDGIYNESKIDVIPIEIKKKYFLRSKDRSKKKVRVISDIRNKINFIRLNFMDESYSVKEMFDIIFCRNVLIYFDRPAQEMVLNKLSKHLKKGGYFFLGHSESILKMNVPLKQIRPSTFVRL